MVEKRREYTVLILSAARLDRIDQAHIASPVVGCEEISNQEVLFLNVHPNEANMGRRILVYVDRKQQGQRDDLQKP